MLDPRHGGGDRLAVGAPGHVVGVEHRLDGPVTDGVRRDPPARRGKGLDPAGERRGVLEEDACTVLIVKVAAHRGRSRHQPAVGIELDTLQPDPGPAVCSPRVELGWGRSLGEPAGQVDPDPRGKRPVPEAGQGVQIPPVPHAHLGDLDQAGRGGAAQAAVQAFLAFFEWLTGRGLRHVHGGRALAPHLLMKGADGGSLPRERRARCLLQQVRVMVNEATDRDTCISGLFHAPIMPGRRASGMASAHHHVDGARLTVGNDPEAAWL